MDYVNKLTGGNKEGEQARPQEEKKSEGGFMDKLNSFAGGGKESEKNEDAVDKGTWLTPPAPPPIPAHPACVFWLTLLARRPF